MTPNNEGFYHAAYFAALAIYIAYAGTIWWRARKLSASVTAMRSERSR